MAKLGFPPAKRHVVETVYDKDGQPTNQVICWTCEREREKKAK